MYWLHLCISTWSLTQDTCTFHCLTTLPSTYCDASINLLDLPLLSFGKRVKKALRYHFSFRSSSLSVNFSGTASSSSSASSSSFPASLFSCSMMTSSWTSGSSLIFRPADCSLDEKSTYTRRNIVYRWVAFQTTPCMSKFGWLDSNTFVICVPTSSLSLSASSVCKY